LGEATPIYMYWKRALPRIREYNPDLKLIMILRNPITRAYSHWNFERLASRESLPFREALLAEPARTAAVLPKQLRNGSYIARGRYTAQLAASRAPCAAARSASFWASSPGAAPRCALLAIGVQNSVQCALSGNPFLLLHRHVSVNKTLEDVLVTAGVGLIACVFLRPELDSAQLMLDFILGPMLEENFPRALPLSRGSLATFVTRPISGTLVSLIGLFILWQLAAFFVHAQRGAASQRSA
jgi:hypothetical protein